MGLKVLRALDTARTQIYHFKAIIIAGMGLFTDAYDLFCIPPIMKLLGHIYYRDNKREEVSIVVVSLLGTACGQIVFGRLGDVVGRRRVYGISLALMIFELEDGEPVAQTSGKTHQWQRLEELFLG